MKLSDIDNERVRLVLYRDSLFDLHMHLQLELYANLSRMIVENEDRLARFRASLLECGGGKWLVFDRETNEFIGEVIAHDFSTSTWELGWDVLPQHQRKGYAFSAASLLMEHLRQFPECEGFCAKIEADNPASISLARKLGGRPSGISMTVISEILGEGGRAAFVREHSELVTDDVRKLACEFGVPPEELLTHALVFDIPKTP